MCMLTFTFLYTFIFVKLRSGNHKNICNKIQRFLMQKSNMQITIKNLSDRNDIHLQTYLGRKLRILCRFFYLIFFLNVIKYMFDDC